MHRIRSKISTDVLSRGFNAGKCKTSLKLAVSRIKLLKNKREAQVRQMRRDLAQLLDSGQDQTARIRVEHVIRDEKTMSAYDLIEIYCELIVARLPIIESQKSCPIDLKEAISSVIFASPRCADIPELMDVRKHFLAKYGKEFVTSALEVRPGCGINRMVVEKLSAKAPDLGTKLNTLTAIAQEHNITWDPKAFEEQLHKSDADLLNGPNTFDSTSMRPVEVSHANLPSVPNQNNKPAFFHPNNSTPSTSVSYDSRYESRAPDIRSDEEFKSLSSREDNAFRDRPVPNMEFKDAASAAQAAAESAERASMAARAAAEFAIHGNVSKQVSTGFHESPTYITRDNKQVKVMTSKLEGAHIAQEFITEEDEPEKSQGMNLNEQNLQVGDVRPRRKIKSIHDSDTSFRNKPLSRCSSHSSGTSLDDNVSEVNIRKTDELKQYQVMDLDEHNLQRDEVDSRRVTNSIYSSHASFTSRPLSRSSSHSSETSINDNVSEVNLYKADTVAYDDPQSIFSKVEPADQDLKTPKNENMESDWQSTSKSYIKSSPSNFTGSSFNDDTIWGSDIKYHDNINVDDSTIGYGERNFGSDQEQPIFSENSAAVFDDYGSDTDDFSMFGRYKSGVLDTSSPDQGELYGFLSSVDTLSPGQYRSGSVVKQSSPQLHFITDTHSVEHSEKSEFLPSFDDNVPATFDKRLSSESEDELINSPISSGGYRKNQETVQKSEDWKESDSSGSSSTQEIIQKTSGSNKTRRNTINSDKDPYCCLDEEPEPSRSSIDSAIKETETKNKFSMPPSHLEARERKTSDKFNYESEQPLNLGRLTGGSRNKAFQHPPYVKSPLVETSVQSQHTTNEADFIVERQSDFCLDNSSASLEFLPDEERYDKRTLQKEYMSNSRTSRARMESDFDMDEEIVSRRTSVRRGYRGEASPSSDKIAEVTEVPAEPYNQRKHLKDYMELSSNSPSSSSNIDNIELHDHAAGSRYAREEDFVQPEQSTDVIRVVEAPKVALYNQKPQRKVYNDFSSDFRVPIDDCESDDNDLEKCDQRHTVHRDKKGVELSRRTRDLPSEATENGLLRFSGSYEVAINSENENKPSKASSAFEPLPNKTHSLQANSSIQLPVASNRSESSAYGESRNTSERDSIQSIAPGNSGEPAPSSSNKVPPSRENSLKDVSHVHPKLPDYDSLAAHFQSLRSNRR